MPTPETQTSNRVRTPVMNKGILNKIIGTVVVSTLCTSAWAEDSTKAAAIGAAKADLSSSGGTFGPDRDQAPSTEPETPTDTLGGGGIMVQNGAAYIVHRLQTEMSLPDGSKIQPDGTVVGRDGSRLQIHSGAMMSLDGRMTDAPFSAVPPAVKSNPNVQPAGSSGAISLGQGVIPVDATAQPPNGPFSGADKATSLGSTFDGTALPSISQPTTGSSGVDSTNAPGTPSSASNSGRPTPSASAPSGIKEPVIQGNGLAPGSISTDDKPVQ